MATVQGSIEIARRPEDVFRVVTDLSRYPEWQESIVSARPAHNGPIAVGSKVFVTRRVGPRQLPGIDQITELDPPRGWSVRATGGPLTAFAKGAIQPIGNGERSVLTITLEFEGHGISKLFVPLVLRQARKQLPRNHQRLKQLIERSP
jgi:uncharacterized protein YndB with AHSA1/START domain